MYNAINTEVFLSDVIKILRFVYIGLNIIYYRILFKKAIKCTCTFPYKRLMSYFKWDRFMNETLTYLNKINTLLIYILQTPY